MVEKGMISIISITELSNLMMINVEVIHRTMRETDIFKRYNELIFWNIKHIILENVFMDSNYRKYQYLIS